MELLKSAAIKWTRYGTYDWDLTRDPQITAGYQSAPGPVSGVIKAEKVRYKLSRDLKGAAGRGRSLVMSVSAKRHGAN